MTTLPSAGTCPGAFPLERGADLLITAGNKPRPARVEFAGKPEILRLDWQFPQITRSPGKILAIGSAQGTRLNNLGAPRSPFN
jgi:hypothetical protein